MLTSLAPAGGVQIALTAADVHPVDMTTVTRWRRYGKDRLYVSGADGVALGWFDLLTDQPHPEKPAHLDQLTVAVRTWQTAGSPDAVPPAPALPTPELSTPESSAGGTPVVVAHEATTNPVPPRATPEPVLPVRPHLDPASASVGRVGVPAAPDAEWTDLAGRRAGALAREQAVALKQAAPVRTFLARVLRVHTDERAWRIGADGEEKVAAQLDKLQGKDPRWHVLHAVPVGEKGSDIDHVVVGPGGVFTLNAKHHPGAKIWVGGNTFMVNGQRQPYVRNSAHEARRAGRLLSAACGVPVTAVGVVVPVGADDVVIRTPPEEVHVIYRRALSEWLRGRPSVVTDADVDRIYAAARRSTTWRTSTNRNPTSHVLEPAHAIQDLGSTTDARTGSPRGTGRP